MKNLFAERLKELREEKGISQRELARNLQVSSAIISKWENRLMQPTADNIIAVADYFNVCADYLLGRKDFY